MASFVVIITDVRDHNVDADEVESLVRGAVGINGIVGLARIENPDRYQSVLAAIENAIERGKSWRPR